MANNTSIELTKNYLILKESLPAWMDFRIIKDFPSGQDVVSFRCKPWVYIKDEYGEEITTHQLSSAVRCDFELLPKEAVQKIAEMSLAQVEKKLDEGIFEECDYDFMGDKIEESERPRVFHNWVIIYKGLPVRMKGASR